MAYYSTIRQKKSSRHFLSGINRAHADSSGQDPSGRGRAQVRRPVDRYKLNLVLEVGDKVRSIRETQVHQWSTTHLLALLVKGFVLDDERLKSGDSHVGDDLDDLLARTWDIRASERRL